MGKKRILTFVGLLVIVALLVSCGGGSKKLDLKLRLEPGKSYSAKMIADQTITQTLMGQTQTITQSIGMAYTYQVQSVDPDGSMGVKITYDWVSYKQDSPMGKVSYDSANPPATVPQAAIGYAALVGRGFSAKMTPTGEISDIRGADQMVSEILEAMNLPAGSARDQVEALLRTQLSDEALKDSFEKAALFYPEKPVAVGDSWSGQIVLASGMPMILDTTWTLKARKNGVATVETRSDVRPNPGAKPMELAGMSISYELSGEQSGSMDLDEKTGWLLGGTLKQDVSGKISAMGTSWPITIVSNIRFEPWQK
ncbi:MAG: hypothetical protein H5T65_13800 [Chloroflexi bacterium]|nr:hypothetical protein [Chloroflexota bacterium]